jgi:hypothetical protein
MDQLARQAMAVPVQATIYMVCPPEASPGWEQGELLRKVQTWNEVSVVIDRAGREARRWNVTTSGHVIVVDPQGQVRFRGGITPGRGQQGSNVGSRWLWQLLSGALPSTRLKDRLLSGHSEDWAEGRKIVTTPVYGCLLWTPTGETREERRSVDLDQSR